MDLCRSQVSEERVGRAGPVAGEALGPDSYREVAWNRYKPRMLGSDPSPRRAAVAPRLAPGLDAMCPVSWWGWWLEHMQDRRPDAVIFGGRERAKVIADLEGATARFSLPALSSPGRKVYAFKRYGTSAMRAADPDTQEQALHVQAAWMHPTFPMADVYARITPRAVASIVEEAVSRAVYGERVEARQSAAREAQTWAAALTGLDDGAPAEGHRT